MILVMPLGDLQRWFAAQRAPVGLGILAGERDRGRIVVKLLQRDAKLSSSKFAS